MVLPVQQKRSNYRILGPVGYGQFGRVYCAMHRKTGKLVAIKLLNRYRLPTHAFLKEVNYLLSLDHPNIVACHALEHVPEGRQLILEYCEGGTLRSLMESVSALGYADILSVTSDIVAGLAHAHQQGIVHCDIKPENVLLHYQDGRWTAKISDFGIAKAVQDLTASSSGQTGSPAYMAPERFYNQYSKASDIYAVGILLFELLTGDRPFSGTPAALMDAHLNNPVPIPDALFGPLKEIVLKALEKIPARRYSDATAMLSALQALEPNQQSKFSLSRGGRPPFPWLPYQPFVGPPLGKFDALIHHLRADSEPAQDATDKGIQRWVLGISEQHIHLQNYRVTDGISTLTEATQTLTPQSILTIVGVRQGFCMVTARSLYGMSSLFNPGNFRLHSIHHWPQNTHIVVPPHGRWFAGISALGSDYQLTVGALRGQQTWPIAQAPLWVDKLFKMPPRATLEQALSIDKSHILLVLKTPQNVTHIEVLARRGLKVGQLDLGLSLHQFTPTPEPYRFLALDHERPTTAIIFDVKPYRVRRLQLEIEPIFLMTMPWGYVFVDAQGRLLLLDRDTLPIGCIEGPPNPVAIYPASPKEILVSTWDKSRQQGDLYAIKLEEFDLEILF